MLIFDGIIAACVIKFFGVNGLYLLGGVCMITFLRMMLKLEFWSNVLEETLEEYSEVVNKDFNKEER